jgi:hypothetical protein
VVVSDVFRRFKTFFLTGREGKSSRIIIIIFIIVIPNGNYDCTETDVDIVIAAEAEADMSANLDTVGVNEPLLFNLRSSRLEDLVGEMGEEKVVGVPNVVVKGRRGEMPERSSSISETDWVRGKGSTEVSLKKFPCPVKKQNLQGRKGENMSMR